MRVVIKMGNDSPLEINPEELGRMDSVNIQAYMGSHLIIYGEIRETYGHLNLYDKLLEASHEKEILRASTMFEDVREMAGTLLAEIIAYRGRLQREAPLTLARIDDKLSEMENLCFKYTTD